MIRWFKNKLDTPMWYVLMMILVLAALIGYFIMLPFMQFMSGIPLDTGAYPNPNIWDKLPPVKDYALQWDVTDIAGLFLCLFLGLVCFLLGITRSINKLSGKQVYMQGLFLVLFAINNLTISQMIKPIIPSAILFYTYWLTFFTYPIALFLYYYFYSTSAFQKWTWTLLAIPAVFGGAGWFLYFVFRMPLDFAGKYYTDIAVVGFIIFMLLGIFGANQKSMAWFIRAIAFFWIGWVCYIIIKKQLGYPIYFHNEYKNGVIISAVVIVCFHVFFNTQEIVNYKSDVQMLSMQNQLAKESYERIKAHLREIGGLKHEMRNHIAAMQIYLNDGRYEEAKNYLSQFSQQADIITDVVYHDNILINAIVGNLLRAAGENGIKVELNLKANPINITDPDLYSLLSNILENALEACAFIPEGCERFIQLNITRREPYLSIYCENSRTGDIISKGDVIRTSKSDRINHGYGLWTIGRITDAYDGFMDTTYDDTTFTVIVALKDQYTA